jgi:serine/threonine kinase 16
VYTAHDPMTGETFALKKILCQTKEQIQMARQEIQIHKSFSHPHIMPLDDYTVLTAENSRSQEYYLLFPFMEVGGIFPSMIHDCT